MFLGKQFFIHSLTEWTANFEVVHIKVWEMLQTYNKFKFVKQNSYARIDTLIVTAVLYTPVSKPIEYSPTDFSADKHRVVLLCI